MPRTKKINNIIAENSINPIQSNNVVEPSAEPSATEPSISEPLKSKRGRKPKKLLEASIINTADKTNININIQENDEQTTTFIDNNNENDIDGDHGSDSDNDTNIKQKPTGKKRGRKPKGGKIVQQMISLSTSKEVKPNVILHLKCSIKDLEYNTYDINNIESYNFSESSNNLGYEIIGSDKNTLYNKIPENTISEEQMEYSNEITSKENDTKDLWRKLKSLEQNLHINNISDKKSACFWCTYDFDNPCIYIPKHHIKDSYHVYGCFCSPECAVAYLMEENIDSSTKFERYYLLNHLYTKIYDYKKNIKPAPNPYYMLDKYYGNLNIQEYRSLLKNERFFLIVDKPLTRILPELHEDNDDFIINNKIIPSNSYNIKRKLQKKQTKTTILNEKFGLISSAN